MRERRRWRHASRHSTSGDPAPDITELARESPPMESNQRNTGRSKKCCCKKDNCIPHVKYFTYNKWIALRDTGKYYRVSNINSTSQTRHACVLVMYVNIYIFQS